MKLEERANAGLHPHVLEKIQSIQAARDSRIVDLGCGSGAMLNRLAELGYTNLCGLDIAPPPTPSPSISFIECDLDACVTPLADESVDLVVSVEVFEHIENLGSLLTELHRVLAPRAAMLLTTPNVHSLEARLRYLLLGKLKQFDALGDPTHILPIFLFPFERVLRRHGFEIESSWGYPLDGSSPTSRFGLQAAARVLRALGVQGSPSGDQLCLLVRKGSDLHPSKARSKRESVTSHYQRQSPASF
ncbi:MAG: class I SAM-dependent methyltransferase [Rhizobacter sp.]|nr:class I SAM-dependent methyltransferase [Rhizobacter sp.]